MMKESHALIRVEPTGKVEVYTEVSPHGQGTETTFAQIVADELGVPPEAVQVLHGDTAMLPSGQGAGACKALVDFLISPLRCVFSSLTRAGNML